MQLSQRENADRRERPRVRVQFRLAVVYRQQKGRPAPPTFHGKTHDLCISGLSLVVDRNIFHEDEVTVLLALPARAGVPQTIIASTAVMSYALHSTKLKAFRVGMTFSEFGGNGKELLQAALAHELKPADVGATEIPGARFRPYRSRDSQAPG